MTVRQYQEVYNITESEDIDWIDKSAWAICFIYGYTEHQVDFMKPKKFLRLVKRSGKLLNKAVNKPFYVSKVNTDAKKIKFGQFIEIITWIRGGIIEQMHMIAASMITDKDHAEFAESILDENIRHYLQDVIKFMESFNDLLNSYKGLFEIEKDIDPEVKPEKPHPFIDQYGWIFSATQVAEFERITLEESFNLPVLQALNALSYLKSKQQYDKK